MDAGTVNEVPRVIFGSVLGSQAKLVDHMSYSVEHNYKESDK